MDLTFPRAAVESFLHSLELFLRFLLVTIFAGGLFVRYFRTRSEIAVFLEPAGDAKAMTVRRFGFAPAKCLCRGLQHLAQPFVFDVLQTKFQRIQVDGMCKFIDVTFAREVICRGGQSPIGTLSQRRIGLMSLKVLVGNVVFDMDAGAARVVVVKIPGRDRAVSLDTA